jgi:serine phosphatase RsbU (regulator of sigma subunit)
MSEATEPAEVLWRICALCTERLGLGATEAYLVAEGDPPRLERVGAAGAAWLEPDGSLQLRLAEVVAGHRGAAIVRGTAAAALFRSNGHGPGTGAVGAAPRTAAVLPLRTANRTLGLLAIRGGLHPRDWSAQTLPALAPYLQQAAWALDRLLVDRESRQRFERLSAILLQVSHALVSHTDLTQLLVTVCDTLVSVTGFQMASVCLYEASANRLEARTLRGALTAPESFWKPFTPDDRLPGLAAESRTTTVELGLQQDGRPEADVERRMGLDTLVSAPLLLRDELLGVLSIGSTRRRDCTRENMEVAQAVANQLSAAVANARLLEETRIRMEEQERAAQELSLLYHTTRAVVGTLELEDRLRIVAESLRQATQTSHCAIFRMERNGLAPWMSVGGAPEETRRFLSLDLAPIEVARLLKLLKNRKAPVVARDTPRDPFATSVWKEEFGIRTAVWLPLLFQNRLTGVALAYRRDERQEFPPEQQRLARAVANMAAVAIRLSQAYEHERNIAMTLQAGLGPTVAARLLNFDIGHGYHPALQEAQVGGDIYDSFSLPDGRVALLMADVSGKGLMAAVQTTMLKNMLRAIAFEDPNPVSVFGRLNRALNYFTDPELFVTAFYGVLCPTTGRLTYCNAGHDCPVLFSAEEGFCTALDTTGIALGMDARSAYVSRQVDLGPGDVLLLYTDGVTECRRDAEFFGRARLEDLLAQLARSKPNRIVSSIYAAVRTYSEGDLHDDIALLVVKAKPSWKFHARS